MKKKLLVGLITALFLIGIAEVASATFVFSDIELTSNSVTFTIDGDMTGYASTGSNYYDRQFSLEYFGDIFLSNSSYENNIWNPSTVFDGYHFSNSGYTGTWSGHNYTWSSYTTNLKNAVATNNRVTISFMGNYFDPTATGQIAFYWGNPISTHTELARVDINNSAPVPEPATMLLFGTGLAGLAGLRKRNKK